MMENMIHAPLILAAVLITVALIIILAMRKTLKRESEEIDKIIKESNTYYENRLSYECVNDKCPLTRIKGYYICDKARGNVNCTGFKERKP